MIKAINNELKQKINSKSFLSMYSIIDSNEAQALFEMQPKAASVYIDFIFTIKKVKYRSRLCAISYDIGYPMLFKIFIDTKNQINTNTNIMHNQDELFKTMKIVLNSNHIKRLFLEITKSK